MPFTFSPLESPKAQQFLERRAAHLETLNTNAQRVFLKSSLEMARGLPLSVDVSAFAKSNVLITLQQWLDQVQEVA